MNATIIQDAQKATTGFLNSGDGTIAVKKANDDNAIARALTEMLAIMAPSPRQAMPVVTELGIDTDTFDPFPDLQAIFCAVEQAGAPTGKPWEKSRLGAEIKRLLEGLRLWDANDHRAFLSNRMQWGVESLFVLMTTIKTIDEELLRAKVGEVQSRIAGEEMPPPNDASTAIWAASPHFCSDQVMEEGCLGTTTTHYPRPSKSFTESDLTEMANARQLVAEFGSAFRWSRARGVFMIYDENEGLWSEDVNGQVDRWAKDIARSFWNRVKVQAPGIERNELIRHAKNSETNRGIKSVMQLASTESGVTVSNDAFDSQSFLLNVKNGVVDLRTGQLQPHAPALMMTKMAPVVFDSAATCPLFDAVLQRIMGCGQEMIRYLQQIFGMALTGDISVQELFVFWGQGANGKSLLCDTFSGILGGYAGLAPPALLTMRSNDEHPTEIADLQGRRLVFASETEESAKLRIQLVKRLTGDARLKARYMRQDYFEFDRTFKLILATNNKPTIGENTNAIWRRLRLIPFTVVIPESEQDLHLLDKLRQEWPGILAWAVRGCLDWQENGMSPPAAVMEATAAYQKEQDVLSEYVAARCTIGGENVKQLRNELFADYLSWAQQTEERHPLERNAFFERIRRLNGVFEKQWRPAGKTTPERGFIGIGLSYKSCDENSDFQG